MDKTRGIPCKDFEKKKKIKLMKERKNNMWKLKLEQDNYNVVEFNFVDIDSATEFVKKCLCCDDEKTRYKLLFDPKGKEEAE